MNTVSTTVDTAETIAKIQANIDAIAASNFGIHFCCKTAEAAIKFASAAQADTNNPFYGDKIEVNNREVVICPPNSNTSYNVRKLAEIFCTEFSNQFGIDIIDFTETVYYN